MLGHLASKCMHIWNYNRITDMFLTTMTIACKEENVTIAQQSTWQIQMSEYLPNVLLQI